MEIHSVFHPTRAPPPARGGNLVPAISFFPLLPNIGKKRMKADTARLTVHGSIGHDERGRSFSVNLRRVIRFSVSSVVFLLSLTAMGVVFFVADEGFGWDIFPDWLEKCLGVVLASVGILTGLSLAACLAASAALIALSLAERQGVETEAASPKRGNRAVRLALAAVLAVAAGGFVLEKVDGWRAEKRKAEAREAHKADYGATKAVLADHVKFWAGQFPPELARAAADGAEEKEREVAELLRSIGQASRFDPAVSLVVRGNPPYAWKRLWPDGKGLREPESGHRPLGTEAIVDFPTAWERDTVKALFAGAELDVPHGRGGLALDTKNPCAWAAVKGPDGEICGLLVFKAPVQRDAGRKKGK